MRLVDVVDHPAEGRSLSVEIEEEVGGARVAVAGLADRARIEEPAGACEVDLRASRSKAACEQSLAELGRASCRERVLPTV